MKSLGERAGTGLGLFPMKSLGTQSRTSGKAAYVGMWNRTLYRWASIQSGDVLSGSSFDQRIFQVFWHTTPPTSNNNYILQLHQNCCDNLKSRITATSFHPLPPRYELPDSVFDVEMLQFNSAVERHLSFRAIDDPSYSASLYLSHVTAEKHIQGVTGGMCETSGECSLC